ncbi:DNA ligase 1-like isoform X2 [Engraulis encrasicolus]
MCVAPLTLLIVGSVYVHDCPTAPFIPIYLIVASGVFLFWLVMQMCLCAQFFLCVLLILGGLQVGEIVALSIIFAWLITGSVYIYGAYQPDFESRSSPEYCDRVLYETAFWCTTLIWLAALLFGILKSYQEIQLCIWKKNKKETEQDSEAGGSSVVEEEQEEEGDEENPATPDHVHTEAGGDMSPNKESEVKEKEVPALPKENPPTPDDAPTETGGDKSPEEKKENSALPEENPAPSGGDNSEAEGPISPEVKDNLKEKENQKEMDNQREKENTALPEENPKTPDVDTEAGGDLSLKEKEKEKGNSAQSDKVEHLPQPTPQVSETAKVNADVVTVESETTA